MAAENFLQHADHYYRVVAAMNEGQRPRIGGREVSVAVHVVEQPGQAVGDLGRGLAAEALDLINHHGLYSQLNLPAVVGLTDLVDNTDVGVRQDRGGPGLRQQPFPGNQMGAEMDGKEFQRHVAVQA